MTPTTRTLSLLLCLLLLGGCAALPPGKRDPRDPWERMNRTTYKVNDKLDKAILRPVARAYRKTPQFVQTGVHNFFTNLDYTIVIINDLLQGQLKPFAGDTARLVINTTVGIGGLLDPATGMGLDRNERDLGQTLGKWGLKTGPYLVLPLLGPSDVRDAFGRLGDSFSTPRQYIRNPYWNYGLYVLETIDLRARLLDASRIVDSAYDPYAFMRNAYLQNRDFKVHGAQPNNEEEQEEKLLEEEGEDQSGTQTSPRTGSAPQSQSPQPPSPQPQPQPQSPQPQSQAPPSQAPQSQPTPPQQ
jgi:phospholipid-binding lipoprotein MlaA